MPLTPRMVCQQGDHVCTQYDSLGQHHRTKLPATVLDHCIATHRYIRVDGPILLENPFYELPETAIHRMTRSEGIEQRMNTFRSKTAR